MISHIEILICSDVNENPAVSLVVDDTILYTTSLDNLTTQGLCMLYDILHSIQEIRDMEKTDITDPQNLIELKKRVQEAERLRNKS